MTVLEELKKILPEIADRFPSVSVLYLFGSHAAGTARARSDVDIAVFTDGSESPLMDLELAVLVEKRLKRPVDVVVMQKVSPILQHEVLRNKIRLFERNPSQRARLEVRSFRAYLDAVYYQEKREMWRKARHR